MNGFRMIYDDSDQQGDHVFTDAETSAADQVLKEELASPETTGNYEITEVVRRIEMAKLYQTLLKHPLFARGTADDSLIEIVEREARGFFYNRLQVLVGIQKETNQVQAPQFSKEEVEALKSLANRVIAKNGPVESQAKASEPMINPVAVSAHSVTPKPAQAKVQPQAQPVPAQTETLPQSNPKYAKPAPVSKTAKKKPLPSQAMMDTMNAQAVGNVASSGGALTNTIAAATKGELK